jgi:hypothetical protein
MIRSIVSKQVALGWIGMVLSLCAISLGTQQTAANGPIFMTKSDLAQHGLSLLLPGEAGYAEELNKLGLNDKPGMDLAKPGSVILKNASPHSIITFGVRWKIKDSTGFVWTRDVMHVEPRGLLDGGRRRTEQVSIPAGSSRLITVEGLIQNPAGLKDFSSSFLAPGFSPVSVQLDLAIFDDGEVVGPDEIGMLPTVKATINAKQDLMEEVSSRLAQGQSLHEALASLQSEAKPAPKTHAPLDPDATYAALRQQYLDELATTERNFGEQVAMRSLQNHKYEIRPDIHRRGNTPN